jgi:hypothetical protein
LDQLPLELESDSSKAFVCESLKGFKKGDRTWMAEGVSNQIKEENGTLDN